MMYKQNHSDKVSILNFGDFSPYRNNIVICEYSGKQCTFFTLVRSVPRTFLLKITSYEPKSYESYEQKGPK